LSFLVKWNSFILQKLHVSTGIPMHFYLAWFKKKKKKQEINQMIEF